MSHVYHLKFYADCPDGQRNKFFCYPVQDGKHACDLLSRFLAKEFRLRAAFIGLPKQLGAALPAAALQWPGSTASMSTMLVKYPSLSSAPAPTPAELDALVAQFPGLEAAIERLRSAA